MIGWPLKLLFAAWHEFLPFAYARRAAASSCHARASNQCRGSEKTDQEAEDPGSKAPAHARTVRNLWKQGPFFKRVKVDKATLHSAGGTVAPCVCVHLGLEQASDATCGRRPTSCFFFHFSRCRALRCQRHRFVTFPFAFFEKQLWRQCDCMMFHRRLQH